MPQNKKDAAGSAPGATNTGTTKRSSAKTKTAPPTTGAPKSTAKRTRTSQAEVAPQADTSPSPLSAAPEAGAAKPVRQKRGRKAAAEETNLNTSSSPAAAEATNPEVPALDVQAPTSALPTEQAGDAAQTAGPRTEGAATPDAASKRTTRRTKKAPVNPEPATPAPALVVEADKPDDSMAEAQAGAEAGGAEMPAVAPARKGRKAKAPALATAAETDAESDNAAPDRVAQVATPPAETGHAVRSKSRRKGKSAAAAPGAAVTVEEAGAAPAPDPRRGRKGKGARGEGLTRVPALPSAPNAAARAEAAQDADEPSAAPAEGPAGESDVREMVLGLFRTQARPLHLRDLERQFTRRDREKLGDRADLELLLEGFVASGDLVRTRKRTYGLPAEMNLVRGRFQSSASGFGFLIPDAGGDDYYVAPEATLEAWNGDIVLVRPEGRERRGDSPRATVVRVLSRAHSRLVGSLEYSKGYALLKSDDSRVKHRVLLMPEGTEGVPAGARVLADLFWPETTGEDEVFGRITKVLGETDDPETETQAVIVKFDLRDEFPPEVLSQAQAIPTRIPKGALEGRLDLRELNIFTVDGRDAKDFDDAIHIQSAPGGNFLVGVHIADVSHYVTALSPLDQEAYKRATSVYLPGRVLPMLPEHLSNGVCSLVPHEDRLTLSAMIEVNADGDVQNVQLAPSVIRSQARLTYDEVQAYSEGVATLPEHARKIEGDLHLLLKLTSRMRQKRLREGSLDFKLREVKVDVDKEGNLQLIPIREETARGMIEDLMLLANKVVARFMLEGNLPALYRVHEEPTLGRFGEVSAALARMGIPLGEEPTPQAYQAALKKVRNTPQETVVNTLLLRSLKQARYAGENLGHFGLAFEEYLHFTSPIRRYPDLIVHRALRAALAGESRGPEMEALRAQLPAMGDHTSERERSAAEAERDLTKYYQAKWAQAHLGESFSGTVSGVTSFGVFVALENGVEGLLHISNLDDDYYFFLEDALMLKGRSTGRTYRLGDSVGITIAQVNPLGRQIDFSQETDMSEDGVKPRARKRGEREQERVSERAPRMGERPPRLAALDEQQRGEQGTDQKAAENGARKPVNGEARRGDDRAGRGRPPRTPSDRLAPPRGERAPGGRSRRVITLDRPRNEHNRPVAVTVQRMYFGDWSMENLREDEGQGGGQSGYRGRPNGGRPQGQQGRPQGQQGQSGQQQPAQAQPQSQGAPSGDAGNRRRRRRRRGNGKSTGGE